MHHKSNINKDHLCIFLTSEHSSVHHAVEETRTFVKKHLDDTNFLHRVALVVSEAVANAIEHGNKYDMKKKVRLDLQWQQTGIAVRVRDEGSGFDPASISDPLAPPNLMQEHGRGLFLIQQMANKVQFEEGGRCLHIFIGQ